MPFTKLTTIPALTLQIAEEITADLTDIIVKDLRKQRDLTSVLIESPSNGKWSIGAAHKTTAAHLEIHVTAGTNSEQEKRVFVSNAMAILRMALPELDPATYIIVKELPAMNWGYDGHTQADRSNA